MKRRVIVWHLTAHLPHAAAGHSLCSQLRFNTIASCVRACAPMQQAGAHADAAHNPEALTPAAAEALLSIVLRFGSSPELLQTVLAAHAAAAIKASDVIASGGDTSRLAAALTAAEAVMQQVECMRQQMQQLTAACHALGGGYTGLHVLSGSGAVCAAPGRACACCSLQAASSSELACSWPLDPGSCLPELDASTHSMLLGTGGAGDAASAPCAWRCLRSLWLGPHMQLQLSAAAAQRQLQGYPGALLQALQQDGAPAAHALHPSDCLQRSSSGGGSSNAWGSSSGGATGPVEQACLALAQPHWETVAALLLLHGDSTARRQRPQLLRVAAQEATAAQPDHVVGGAPPAALGQQRQAEARLQGGLIVALKANPQRLLQVRAGWPAVGTPRARPASAQQLSNSPQPQPTPKPC